MNDEAVLMIPSKLVFTRDMPHILPKFPEIGGLIENISCCPAYTISTWELHSWGFQFRNGMLKTPSTGGSLGYSLGGAHPSVQKIKTIENVIFL